MGQIKAVFRDVKTEHLEKLFGGKIIAVHEISCVTAIETDTQVFMLTGGEAALLRALTDLDVQRTKDIAGIIAHYENLLATEKDVLPELVKALRTEKEVIGKKLELVISANEAQRAAINEMRDSLKTAEAALKSMHPQKPLYQGKAKDGRKLYTGKPAKKVKK